MLRSYKALLMMLGLVLAGCGAAQPTTPAGSATSAPATSAPAQATAAPAGSATSAPATSAPAQATAAPAGSATSAPAASGGTAPNPCTSEAASAERPDPPILEIGTGNTGGVFFPYGGGIARVLTDKLPG